MFRVETDSGREHGVFKLGLALVVRVGFVGGEALSWFICASLFHTRYVMHGKHMPAVSQMATCCQQPQGCAKH